MEKYKVNFLQNELEDLEEIILYLAQDSVKSAKQFNEKVVVASKRSECFPKMGRFIPDKKMQESGFRMIVIDSYLLFYKIYGDEINVLRILHGKTNYPMLWSSILRH